ncbi:ester cyclase [Flexithrix dorotheae]|uniref:ester cyclase n=1 Tax=Flexithrix dorotheae TaxID=70993 RepID=UPI00037781A4|nr:ester cyclase [Flexithrix dorotheae]
MEIQSNKNIVELFYRKVIGDRDLEVIEELVSEDYIQHSPMTRDGKSGLIEAITYLKTFPKPAETKSPIVRIIEDGELVMAFLDLAWMGKKMAVVDIFRIKQGKLCEHWDVIQEQPEEVPNSSSITMVNGGTELNALELTVEHKAFIIKCFQSVFVERKLDLFDNFFSDELVNHLPESFSENKDLVNYLSENGIEFSDFFKVLCQGNYTGVQSKGKRKQKPFVFNFIFRLEGKKIKEIWGVSQEIPEDMLHQNGMI